MTLEQYKALEPGMVVKIHHGWFTHRNIVPVLGTVLKKSITNADLPSTYVQIQNNDCVLLQLINENDLQREAPTFGLPAGQHVFHRDYLNVVPI